MCWRYVLSLIICLIAVESLTESDKGPFAAPGKQLVLPGVELLDPGGHMSQLVCPWSGW